MPAQADVDSSALIHALRFVRPVIKPRLPPLKATASGRQAAPWWFAMARPIGRSTRKSLQKEMLPSSSAAKASGFLIVSEKVQFVLKPSADHYVVRNVARDLPLGRILSATLIRLWPPLCGGGLPFRQFDFELRPRSCTLSGNADWGRSVSAVTTEFIMSPTLNTDDSATNQQWSDLTLELEEVKATMCSRSQGIFAELVPASRVTRRVYTHL